ncbi:unnamed protein product [Nezara viridula]|uniref:Neuropeptide n=1 Tax=Nezara viridula TaxID=85310 RepID=A0A9P0E786_NEZVI|nr:unnamed protein product [Nezara viridula]
MFQVIIAVFVLAALLNLAAADGDSEHKKVIIHVPFKVQTVHHHHIKKIPIYHYYEEHDHHHHHHHHQKKDHFEEEDHHGHDDWD